MFQRDSKCADLQSARKLYEMLNGGETLFEDLIVAGLSVGLVSLSWCALRHWVPLCFVYILFTYNAQLDFFNFRRQH